MRKLRFLASEYDVTFFTIKFLAFVKIIYYLCRNETYKLDNDIRYAKSLTLHNSQDYVDFLVL